jgi:hypothetical protein
MHLGCPGKKMRGKSSSQQLFTDDTDVAHIIVCKLCIVCMHHAKLDPLHSASVASQLMLVI